MSTDRTQKGATALAAAFAVSGTLHFVRPQFFEPLVPPALPAPRALVYLTGAMEVVAAAGLLTRRRWAPALSVATLLAVWPGNIHYAMQARTPATRLLGWARVPMQVPMMVVAAKAPVLPSCD